MLNNITLQDLKKENKRLEKLLKENKLKIKNIEGKTSEERRKIALTNTFEYLKNAKYIYDSGWFVKVDNIINTGCLIRVSGLGFRIPTKDTGRFLTIASIKNYKNIIIYTSFENNMHNPKIISEQNFNSMKYVVLKMFNYHKKQMEQL